LTEIIDFVLHSDRYLAELVQSYGPWVYGFLFAIIFAETGLVVTPFLPGDSLLFAVGALAGTGTLSVWYAGILLFVAAFTGNAVNYAIGRTIGPKVFHATDHTGFSHKLLNRDHLKRAHEFFERYGGKAVILGRFVPIVRTFVPFVAGAAQMSPPSFVFFNFVGAAAWVGLCVGAGYFFGNFEIVKKNFSLVTIAIVFVSLLPVIVEFIRHKRRQRIQAKGPGPKA
jgi:membrane-associated protein